MPDEVDDVMAAWARERPDLDVTPLAVLSRISRLARSLDRQRRQIFAAHGLEAFEFDVLAALRRSGPPYALSPGDLVRQTMVSSGTMTNRIDRLATRRLVRRTPDPEDGRAVLVRLQRSGRLRVDAALGDLLDHERAVLGVLRGPEQDRLATLLRRLSEP